MITTGDDGVAVLDPGDTVRVNVGGREAVRESVAGIIKKTGKSREEVVAHFVKDVPMGRLIQPQEVAAAVLYLCSPDAGAVTGTALAVAGGEV